MAKEWTEADITQLKRLVNERKTAKEIGRILGRTHRAIDRRKRDMGLYKPMMLSPHNPLHVAEVIKFKMAGWTLSEIAAIYKCSPQHVSRVLTLNGMVGFIRNPANPQRPYTYWTEYELHRLRKYCKKGYGLERICTYFPNRSHKAVRMRIFKMTRYWMTPEQQEERRLLKKREWQWRVW